MDSLDLSWNHLRRDGGVLVAEGLAVSLTFNSYMTNGLTHYYNLGDMSPLSSFGASEVILNS